MCDFQKKSFEYTDLIVNMSKCLRDNIPFLQLLIETSENQRQHLLDSATPCQVRAIAELCINIYRRRFNKAISILDTDTRKEVLKNILPVQKAATKNISFRKKRKLLSKDHRDQKGAGLFSVLLPLALSVLPGLIKK